MARTCWISTLAVALSFTALAGEPKRVVLDVPGMDCSPCPISVKKALLHVPGVIDAKADLATRRAEATYDPGRVSPETLAKAVGDAGFPASIRKP